jgi:hypothetical protein
MPIRPIIGYPDPRLAIPAQPVTVFDGALRGLARDLLDTMHAAPGIGITAPHIGISLRVVVLDLDPIDGARTYVNPEIIWESPEMTMHQEGSVSMPGVNDDISVMPASGSTIATSTATCRPRSRRACAPSATSMRSISSTACSGSSGCPASSASG